MRVLGEAIHACIGLSFADPEASLSETDVLNVLSGFGMSEYVSATAVLHQIQAFQEWLSSRWLGARPHAEIPLMSILQNGQVLNGRVDLLLETNGGWVLFDHKSSQLAIDKWGQLANEYCIQLESYALGIERTTGKKVIEQWLFLPVAGGALSIERLGWA